MTNKNYNSTLQSNNTDLQAILDAINELPEAGGGIELPELDEPATVDEVFLNQEYIDADGTKRTGTFTIEEELTEQNSLIAQLQNMVDNLPEAGESGGEGECTDDAFAQSIEGYLTELNSNATAVNDGRFHGDITLETVNLPFASYLGDHAFGGCENLTTVKIPRVESIAHNAFSSCSSLQLVDCSTLIEVRDGAFNGSNLQAFVIRNTSQVASLENINAFDDTPISNGNGYIYVPSSMIDAYIEADNWSDYADQFRVLEDYTVDGTITGELDVEFSDNVEFTVFTWDFDQNGVYQGVGSCTANPEMPWGELIFGDNNDGSWLLDDNGYVMYNNQYEYEGQYYVFNPLDSCLVIPDVPIGYLYMMVGEPSVVVITAEEAQQFM